MRRFYAVFKNIVGKLMMLIVNSNRVRMNLQRVRFIEMPLQCAFCKSVNWQKHLSDEYKLHTADKIPWHQVQGLCNVVAHEYGKIDTDLLWETITEDIPRLRDFCTEQLGRVHINAQHPS